MIHIKKISLAQFRNYSSAVFDFTARVTCITGANGSGKTNLLDAVYYLCYTKSYFSAYQQNCALSGTDGFRVTGQMAKGDIAETISCKWQAGKKELTCNQVSYDRVNDHIGRYAAVMIAPDDTELINGGSENRRKWIDGILGQADHVYLEKLLHYQQVLLQRNAWLKLYAVKPAMNFIELEYYDAQLAASSIYIYQERLKFLEGFIPMLNDFYLRLSGNKETISIFYKSDLSENKLSDLLTQYQEHDIRMQRTLKGIHKDDWEFGLNGLNLKQFGSQGQKKSFLFALKLSQFAYLARVLGHTPVLLLDDIFEKLDQSRMESLLQIITGKDFGQVLLTDTHSERVKLAFGHNDDLGFIEL